MLEREERFNGVILDIDGTIWNTTGIVAVAWNRTIDMYRFDARKVNAQDLQKEFGKTMDVIAKDLWPNLSLQDREILMAHCCSEEQLALKNNEIDIMYPNVLETVKELSQQFPFYIVSNCQNGYIELTLEKTGLAPYVKDFECFGRTGKGKAENLMMLIARNQISMPLYVGDTQGDCDACRQAGVPFAWASYGFGQGITDYAARLDDFSGLKDVLFYGQL